MGTRACKGCGYLVSGAWRCDSCKGRRSTTRGPRKTGAPKQGGTTTERGYGGEHQAARRQALAALADGDPCPYCGQGMWRGQTLDLDHAIPQAIGGVDSGPRRLTHASCNRREGARLGNRLRAGKPPLPPAQLPQQRGSRDW